MIAAVGAFVRPWEEAFDASRGTITLIGSLSFLVYGGSQPFVGRAVDRFGIRRTLVVSSLLVAAGLALSAAAHAPDPAGPGPRDPERHRGADRRAARRGQRHRHPGLGSAGRPRRQPPAARRAVRHARAVVRRALRARRRRGARRFRAAVRAGRLLDRRDDAWLPGVAFDATGSYDEVLVIAAAVLGAASATCLALPRPARALPVPAPEPEPALP